MFTAGLIVNGIKTIIVIISDGLCIKHGLSRGENLKSRRSLLFLCLCDVIISVSTPPKCYCFVSFPLSQLAELAHWHKQRWEKKKRTQTRSCVITTSPWWHAACSAEPGSRSANRDLEDRARLTGALMSSLEQWARRSSSLGRLCSITAMRRRPASVMSGPSLGEGGGSGATNSFCSYLALIQDSRSSLKNQEK